VKLPYLLCFVPKLQGNSSIILYEPLNTDLISSSPIPVNPVSIVYISLTQSTPQPAMERYTIVVALPGVESFRLLVPFQPALSISTLAIEVKRRVSRLEVVSDGLDITLHLGDANGPMLDEEDALADVILDPKSEEITVVSKIKKTTDQDMSTTVSSQ
jgi:hypothetical protein